MKSLIYQLFLVTLVGCQSVQLPTKHHAQYTYQHAYAVDNDHLSIELGNPLQCPLRVWIQTPDNDLQAVFNKINPVELDKVSDTLLHFQTTSPVQSEIQFASRLGSLKKAINPIPVDLPFAEGKEYRVIQGNNSNYTHNSSWSRYAVDFNLKTNDTICAATSGFIVGVVEAYEHGGKGDQWKPFGNYITVYDPNSGLFTQYVHLTKDGSFVNVGDYVNRGQPIGLSGKTGQTDIEHLHFNVLIPANNNDGLKSIPFEFASGQKSEELSKNDWLRK